MNTIMLCATASDSICQIDLESYYCNKIKFHLGDTPVGPHGLKIYDNKILTSNSYSDSVSIFSTDKIKEIKNIKIGPRPNDVIFFNNEIYTVCGESNSVVIYNLTEDKTIGEISTGSWPHSMDIYKDEYILVSNLESNNISVISLKNYDVTKNISVPEYPSKIKISNYGEVFYVCCSYLGKDQSGYIDIFSTVTFERLKRVQVGYSPIDLFEDEKNLYISNFSDGSVSIINKCNYTLEKNLFVGGMPKGIIKYNNKLFIADYLRSKLIIVDENENRKAIAIESEPNAMTLF